MWVLRHRIAWDFLVKASVRSVRRFLCWLRVRCIALAARVTPSPLLRRAVPMRRQQMMLRPMKCQWAIIHTSVDVYHPHSVDVCCCHTRTIPTLMTRRHRAMTAVRREAATGLCVTGVVVLASLPSRPTTTNERIVNAAAIERVQSSSPRVSHRALPLAPIGYDKSTMMTLLTARWSLVGCRRQYCVQRSAQELAICPSHMIVRESVCSVFACWRVVDNCRRKLVQSIMTVWVRPTRTVQWQYRR